jgi:type II secretory pathway component GspD/PulD (secretin)
MERARIQFLATLSLRALTIALSVAVAALSVLAQEREEKVQDAPKNSASTSPADAVAKQDPPPAATSKSPVEDQLHQTPDGKIRFSFRSQRWLDVLQWLATSSNRTLDWQELPEGELNLDTRQSFTLDEARDLLNMHLAARGFTLLRRGEVLSLTKLDKLNPAIVPRVQPEELASRDPHEVVRVSFPLNWLVAEDSVKEFQPMLSQFGKLTAMTATNRLEGLDTVANLREIQKLLDREQSSGGRDRLVVEFKLKHVRAEDILHKLRELVGAPANSRLQAAAQFRRQFERMRERSDEGRNNDESRRPARQEPEVHLVVNEQENSILAHARPDKLAVIGQAVQALDVPAGAGAGLRDTVTRMKIYRTKAIDPDAMRDLIQELIDVGKLQANTQVQADDDSNTLIVYATPQDHLAIANLVSQVDDDGRDVRIIPLRQLDPDYALQAVRLLLQGQQSSGEEGRGRWRGGGGGGSDTFRIEADLERSRLLLWASDSEFDQVKALLAKLGEEAGATHMPGGVRIIQLPANGKKQVLDSMRQIWPNMRDNPLQIRERRSEVRESAIHREQTRVTAPTRFAVAAAKSQDEAKSEPIAPADNENQRDEDAPPINVTEGPGGQIIITSKDAEALNAADSLLQQLLPQQGDYQVFRLKHVSPLAIELTLKQIFGLNSTVAGERGTRLPQAARTQLQFVSDLDTGTLLVQGATPAQIAKIEELIELYDQPETLDSDLKRKTEIYEVKYSRADAVAEVVKEVYRDLLSANDKAFTRDQRDRDSPSRDVGYGANYGSKIPQFRGLLSVGVEEKTNVVVVSAPDFLMGEVMSLVREVDETAAGHRVKVVKLNGVGADTLRQVFSQMPGVTASPTASGTSRPAAASGAPATQPAPQSASENRDNDRSNNEGRRGGENRREGRR